jgi:hypothetical protein
MKTILNLFLLSILSVSCKPQKIDTIAERIPTKGENCPFYLDNKIEQIQLPDSLGGNNLKGIVDLVLFIDTDSKIKKFRIMTLRLKDLKENQVVNFYKYYTNAVSDLDYPNNVRKYYPFFKKYVSQLPIKKDELSKIDSINIIIFRFKIGEYKN